MEVAAVTAEEEAEVPSGAATVAKEAAEGDESAAASQNAQPRQRHQPQCSSANAAEHHPKQPALTRQQREGELSRGY